MRRNFLIIFLVSVAFIILSMQAYAEEARGEVMKLYLGEPTIISVNNPTRIVIGNPGIADVANITKSQIALNPKAIGTTTFVFWDNFGEQAYQVKVYAENMQEVKHRVDNLLKELGLPGVYTRAEDEEAKVLILGKVKTAQDRERVATALETLKDKIVDLITIKEEEAVVEIDVQVLELDKDAEKTLGVAWPTSSGDLTEPFDTKRLNTIPDAFFRLSSWTRGAFTAKVNFLLKEGKARVLSRPQLACQSGKEAKLLVGGEIPIFTATVAGTGTATGNVEYKEYGIILNIKPKVDESRRVHLALKVEVSEVDSTPVLFGTTGKAFPLKKRNASTELIMDDGQTLSIGGLITQKSTEDLQKLPWLADIPVLGIYFRNKSVTQGGGAGQRGNTELFITLTPTVIGDEEISAGRKGVAQAERTVKPKIASLALMQNIPAPVAGYVGLVQKRILEKLKYPESARQSGFQGTVKLNLRLSYNGELLGAAVKESSGYKVLDDNAVSAANSSVSYPPFPPSIKEKEIQIDVPVTFQLD